MELQNNNLLFNLELLFISVFKLNFGLKQNFLLKVFVRNFI